MNETSHLSIVGPLVAIVPHCIKTVCKHFAVKEVAADHEPGASFASFAVDHSNVLGVGSKPVRLARSVRDV